MRGVLEDRRPLAAPADLPRLRQGRLLRQLAEPACDGTRQRQRTPPGPLPSARRGLVVVLRRRDRSRDPGGPGRDPHPGVTAGRLMTTTISWPALSYDV